MLSEEYNIEGYVVSVKKRLAEGGFGFIDLVNDARTNRDFCLKRCSIQSEESQAVVEMEIAVLRKFRCENIVNIIGSEMKQLGRNKTEAFILLEYCSRGHLLDILNRKAGSVLSVGSITDIFSQVLKAVGEMHAHNPPVTHRDLKLENILLTSDSVVKLCDFGSCVYGHVPLTSQLERSKAEEVIEKTTTQMYRAPEMVDLFMRDKLTERTDTWALGCILYALCFISHPFQEAGNLGILSAKVTMPSESSIPDTARTLIMRMLDVDPEARPTIEQLKSATLAISHGTSLPPFEISDEAKRIKAEREAALQRRQTLQNKKTNLRSVPQRAPVKLDPNSAAARRLAAKRGIRADSSATSQSTKPSGNNNWGFGNFDDVNNSATTTFENESNKFDQTASFEGNFDATNSQEQVFTSDIFFSDEDKNIPSNTNVSSKNATDMFFTDFDEPATSNQDDGFGNFDLNDNDTQQTITPAAGTVASSDLFFSASLDNNDVEEHVESGVVDIAKNVGFNFFQDDTGGDESNLDHSGFPEMFKESVSIDHNSVAQGSTDFFSAPTPSSDNPFDDDKVNFDVPEATVQSNFDPFGTSSQEQSTHSFQPPQNDPFDMFSNSSSTTSGSSGGGGSVPTIDIFSSDVTMSEPSPNTAKTASVMQMFNSSSQVDPFAQIQPQQTQGYGYAQNQMQYGNYGQQPNYGHHQQQFGTSVRQINPSDNKNKKDPFGSLIGQF